MTSLTGLYRYPVKALGGEAVDAVDVNIRGLIGDRSWAVHEGDGRLATGKNGRRFRRRDELFDLRAHTCGKAVDIEFPDGTRQRAGSHQSEKALSRHLGVEVALRHEDDGSHFDDGPVSLVGTASLRAAAQLLGEDTPLAATRLRANLVVSTSEPYEEESWFGSRIGVGSVVFVATEPIVRCRMVDIAQVGLPPKPGLLKVLGQRRQTCLAVYLRIERPGRIQVGDTLRFL